MTTTRRWTLLLAGAVLAALPMLAGAQEEGGTKTARELRASYDKALQGKTIAYLPIALGVPLSDEWGRVVKEEAEWRGMKYVVRDPNNNPSAMQQALTALVDQKPDVLIVQNPSVTLLMKDLKRAEAQGTHVIQILNKDSNIKVVSNQAANWDANTALNVTATVIQQHPDLCASIGFWGIMESGAAQAIRNAGKIDDVKVYASGEGSQLD